MNWFYCSSDVFLARNNCLCHRWGWDILLLLSVITREIQKDDKVGLDGPVTEAMVASVIVVSIISAVEAE